MTKAIGSSQMAGSNCGLSQRYGKGDHGRFVFSLHLTFLQNSLLRAFSAMDLNGMQWEASQSYA